MSSIFSFRRLAAPLASSVLFCTCGAPAFAQNQPTPPAAGQAAPVIQETPDQVRQRYSDLNNAIYSKDNAKVENLLALHPEMATKLSQGS